MTILIFDDITTLTHWLERATTPTDQPGTGFVVSIAHQFERVQAYADRMAAETLAVVHEMRAQLIELPPQFGHHLPGLITPRIVDNADRSGAYQFRTLASDYHFQKS